MELRHLRYFTAVAETSHFGRAAERLHLAQPALSQSIRHLEDELGARLFERTTRQVRLTPAGRFLLDEARRILAASADAERGVRRIVDGRLGLVRIAFTGTAAFTELPRMARAVRRDLPEVVLEIHADLLTPAQAAGLRDGTLDIGVLRPPTTGGGLALRTIKTEPLLLAVPGDHRLATEPVVAMTDLRTEEFVSYSDSHSAVNDAVMRSCREAGFTPRGEQQAPSTAALLALISAGLGVALVPASVRAVPLAGVVFRDVVDAATTELACAWRADAPSPVVRSVLASLQDAGVFADSPAQPATDSSEAVR